MQCARVDDINLESLSNLRIQISKKVKVMSLHVIKVPQSKTVQLWQTEGVYSNVLFSQQKQKFNSLCLEPVLLFDDLLPVSVNKAAEEL